MNGTDPLRLTCLRRADAKEIDQALQRLLARHHAAAARTWAKCTWELAHAAVADGRWITRETLEELAATRRAQQPEQLNSAQALAMLSEDDLRAVEFCREVDLAEWVAARNEEILAAERARCAEFFDTVESRPLTEEQVRAVVTG